MKRLALILVGFLLAAAATEVALRLLPVSSGFAYLPVDDANPVLRSAPFHRYIVSRDWDLRLAQSGTLKRRRLHLRGAL